MASFKDWANAIMSGVTGNYPTYSTCSACSCTPCMCPPTHATGGGWPNNSSSLHLHNYGAISGAIASGYTQWSQTHAYKQPSLGDLYKGQCRNALKGELTDEEFSKVTLEEYEKYVNLASEALGEFLSDGANAVRGWQTFRKVVEEMRRSVAQGEPTAALDAELTFHKLAQKESDE